MPRDLDPGPGRRRFSKLARRMLYPATATRVSLVYECANGHLHKGPSYRAPPELDHAGCCGRESEGRHWQDLLLVRHQEVRIRPHSRGSRVQLINSAHSTDAGCQTSKLVKACPAYALSSDGNSGIISAQLCKWPFAHIAIISSTPELHHAACCGREPEGRHWQDLLLVPHQEVRIRPHPRRSRIHHLSSALRPMPGARPSKLVKA